MYSFASGAVLLWLACCSGPLTASSATTPTALRTFIVQKDPAARQQELDDRVLAASAEAPVPPAARSLLRTTLGVGYVQHADWGSEVLAAGTVAGLDVQLDSLASFGDQGARFDHGIFSIGRRERGWLIEAGDLFSDVAGPSNGFRLGWQVSNHWRPTLALHKPQRGSVHRSTVVVYGSQLSLGRLSTGMEFGSDRSHFVKGRLATSRRFDVEASYRGVPSTMPLRDAGIRANWGLGHGVSLGAGLFRSDRGGDSSEWRTLSVRVPVGHRFGLTLERSLTASNTLADSSAAAMIDLRAGSLLVLHRYQWGTAQFPTPGGAATVDREQLQSMAAYSSGPRLNVTLQSAAQWTFDGRREQWLELQANVRATARTSLQVATPMPGQFDSARFRARLEQQLRGRYAVVAEYGRPSSYQEVQNATEVPRFKVLVRRTWDVSTVAPGGDVRGVVIDYIGRPVPGARVRLGPYSADADMNGAYVFENVPRGDFDLELDPALLPADYAWDGRARHLSVTPATRARIELVVAPLNAIHGRVYADRNGNGRFDSGEGVLGAAVCLDERVTATDANGAYDFYNVPPGAHTVRLDSDRLPEPFAITNTRTLQVELREGRPATGADFVVLLKTKAIIWREIK